MRRCSAEGCEKPHLARGFCNKHYLRWRTAGGQTTPRPPLWTPEEDVALLAIELTPHTERYQGRGAFAVIADRLGRTVQACTDRYRRLMRDGGHVPGQQWTEEGLWDPGGRRGDRARDPRSPRTGSLWEVAGRGRGPGPDSRRGTSARLEASTGPGGEGKA